MEGKRANLLVMSGLTAPLSALLLHWEEEHKACRDRETDGPIPNCRTPVFRLCAATLMS